LRLFRIINNNKFTEYKEQIFKNTHNEKMLESWLEKNPESIIEDGALMTIGRQVATSFSSYIDLLTLDKAGNTAVVELKRDRTPRDTLAQALEYASFVANLSYEQLEQIFRRYTQDENETLSEYHKAYFKLGENEGVTFNKDQRVVIIGYDISSQVRETASFLRKKGIRVSCIEFKYFQTESGEQLMSHNIVVGKEPILQKDIVTASLPKINKKKFLETVDEAGYEIFEKLLKLAEEHRLPIHWGSKGFSINKEIDGTHVQLCFCYPPQSVSQQSIYTGFYYIEKKVKEGDTIVTLFRDRFEKTGLFFPSGTGNDLKALIQKPLSQPKITELSDIILDLASVIQKNGLKE
jgi:hypothetical protein